MQDQRTPVILVAAVLQGAALYALHRAVTADVWPATHPGWLLACYSLAVLAPLTLQMLVEHASLPRLLPYVAAIGAAAAYFGWHHGHYVVASTAVEFDALTRTPSFGMQLAVLWLMSLPFLQCRLIAGHWDARLRAAVHVRLAQRAAARGRRAVHRHLLAAALPLAEALRHGRHRLLQGAVPRAAVRLPGDVAHVRLRPAAHRIGGAPHEQRPRPAPQRAQVAGAGRRHPAGAVHARTGGQAAGTGAQRTEGHRCAVAPLAHCRDGAAAQRRVPRRQGRRAVSAAHRTVVPLRGAGHGGDSRHRTVRAAGAHPRIRLHRRARVGTSGRGCRPGLRSGICVRRFRSRALVRRHGARQRGGGDAAHCRDRHHAHAAAVTYRLAANSQFRIAHDPQRAFAQTTGYSRTDPMGYLRFESATMAGAASSSSHSCAMHRRPSASATRHAAAGPEGTLDGGTARRHRRPPHARHGVSARPRDRARVA